MHGESPGAEEHPLKRDMARNPFWNRLMAPGRYVLKASGFPPIILILTRAMIEKSVLEMIAAAFPHNHQQFSNFPLVAE
jgi:hypothetical protein